LHGGLISSDIPMTRLFISVISEISGKTVLVSDAPMHR
jgi:hypothetical protein